MDVHGNDKAFAGCEKEDVVVFIPEEDGLKQRNQINDSAKDAGSGSFSVESESPGRFRQSPPLKEYKNSDSGLSKLDNLKSKVSVATTPGTPFPETPKIATSPKRPPKYPVTETLTRRSLSRSTISKFKSRFVEPTYQTALKRVEEHVPPKGSNSPFLSSPHFPPTATPNENIKSTTANPRPRAVAAEEEEEEDEIYRSEDIPVREKCRRTLKFWNVVGCAAFVSTITLLVVSSNVHPLQHSVIWGLVIWKWCMLVIVIFCGRLVTDWFIGLLVFLIELNFALKKKVFYFVHGLKRSVKICIWAGLVLLTWFLLFDHGVKRPKTTGKILNYVSRTLGTFLVGSVVWLLKTLLLKILASSFHATRYFDRIQESIYHQYLLFTLSGPRVMEMAEQVGRTKSAHLSFRTTVTDNGKGGEEQGVINVGKLHKTKQEKVSAFTMRRLIDTITSSGLSTISNSIEEIASDFGGEHQEITSELEAKAAAHMIFKNVAKPDSKYIEIDDLMRFLSKEEVVDVLQQFEGAAETGRIKKKALKNWTVKVYLERKSLAHSLNDTKTAVKQLDKLAACAVIIMIVIIWMLLMGFANTKVFVFITSQLVLVAFVFGNTCKTIFEAIIFVFVMHPFDVGDRCVIDGVQMIVEEMNILTTVFLRFDNEKIFYPNAVLATKPISNFYRSPNMGDAVEFSIDVSTSMERIGAFKERIKMYIDSKPQHWQTNHTIVVKEIENVNKMKMALYLSHTINFQNMGEIVNRKSELIFEMKKIFEVLSIKYHLLPQEVHLRYIGSTMPPTSILGQ